MIKVEVTLITGEKEVMYMEKEDSYSEFMEWLCKKIGHGSKTLQFKNDKSESVYLMIDNIVRFKEVEQ